jgi:3alpha(or 20beta)-hydroxysteroid dehydrogenase
VNFSSPQGLEGRDRFSAYAASKFGVRALTKCARFEVCVRVNAVIPGPTCTTMTQHRGWSEADYSAAHGFCLLSRMAQPEEIAALCLFLSSDDASFCTPADFVADGGLTAGKPRHPS